MPCMRGACRRVQGAPTRERRAVRGRLYRGDDEPVPHGSRLPLDHLLDLPGNRQHLERNPDRHMRHALRQCVVIQ